MVVLRNSDMPHEYKPVIVMFTVNKETGTLTTVTLKSLADCLLLTMPIIIQPTSAHVVSSTCLKGTAKSAVELVGGPQGWRCRKRMSVSSSSRAILNRCVSRLKYEWSETSVTIVSSLTAADT